MEFRRVLFRSADVPTLRAWIAEGILSENTRLTRATAAADGSPLTSASTSITTTEAETLLASELLGSEAKAEGVPVATAIPGTAAEQKKQSKIYIKPEDNGAGSSLRPLTNAEMLDRTFQVYRHHFLQLFLMAALLSGPPFLLHGMLSVVGMDKIGVQVLSQDLNMLSVLPDTPIIISVLGAMLAALCLEWLGSSVLTAYVADLYLERRVTIGRAFWSLRGKILRVLVTNALRCVLLMFLASLPFIAL